MARLVWLCVALLATVALCSKGAMASKSVAVCVLDRPPVSFCSVDHPNDPSKWEQEGGFGVQLFAQAHSSAGGSAVAGTSLSFTCINATTGAAVDALAQLTPKDDPLRKCDVLIGSVTVTANRSMNGVQFSFPFANPSLGTVVSGQKVTTNGMYWIKPFSFQLWAVLACTSFVFVPAVVSILVVANRRRHSQHVLGLPLEHPAESHHGVVHGAISWWRMYVYSLFSGFSVMLHGDNPESDEGPALVNMVWLARATFFFGFAFVGLVFVATYTANFSAVLGGPTVSTSISSLAGFYGQPVLTAQLYMNMTRNNWGVLPKDAKVVTGDSMLERLAQVASGEYAGIIWDSPMMIWGLQKLRVPGALPDASACLVLLRYQFLPRSYAFAFAKNFSQGFVVAISNQLMELTDSGDLAEKRLLAWEGLVENGTLSTCDDGSAQQELGLRDVWVLFVVLAAFGLLSVLLALCSLCPCRRTGPGATLPRAVERKLSSGSQRAGPSMSPMYHTSHVERWEGPAPHSGPLVMGRWPVMAVGPVA